MLLDISITNVRNIENASFEFGEKFTIFFGENGSGKTSVIESIYLLATAKSFRSNRIRKIINENNQSLTVFGRITGAHDLKKVGIEKTPLNNVIRINGKTVKSVSELAECLPVLVIEQDSHKLIESGPQWRRKFIDWGLFHVEHDFNSVWSAYRKSLKQRNALLFQGADENIISSWTKGLVVSGETYSRMREEHVALLNPYFTKYVDALLKSKEFSLAYRRGWPNDVSLEQCMAQQLQRDRTNCRTNYGPHRADLLIKKNGKDASDHVSRGQQKLLVYALNLAQVSLLKDLNHKETILLLDDLGSELDIRHSQNLLTLLETSFGQVCITTANLNTIPVEKMLNVKLFHVEHGAITAVSTETDKNLTSNPNKEKETQDNVKATDSALKEKYPID